MIKGNYDIYDIAPDGTRTLVAKSSNAVIASSWNISASAWGVWRLLFSNYSAQSAAYRKRAS